MIDPVAERVNGTPRTIRLAIISGGRGVLHLDAAAPQWQAGLDDVRATIETLAPRTEVLLAGGEPTLHPRLPEILDLLSSAGFDLPGMVTDGLALADGKLARELMARGLRRVVIQIHCARPAGHDFVAGIAGAARRMIPAVRTCRELRLDVEAEIVMTRPTVAHLAETVAVLHRLGIERVRLSWLAPSQVEDSRVVCLVARLLLQTRHVAAATKLARQFGVDLSLAGVPECLRAACGADAPRACTEPWVVPAAAQSAGLRLTPHGPGRLVACTRCQAADQPVEEAHHPSRSSFPRKRESSLLADSWTPAFAGVTEGTGFSTACYRCAGAPAEYVATFGWLEIDMARRPE